MNMIFDSHLDLAWAALFHDRDLTQPVTALRENESAEGRFLDEAPTVSLPQMRQGGVRFCVATVFARCRRRLVESEAADRVAVHDYSSPAQAFANGQAQIAYYHQLQRQGELRLLTAGDELLDHAVNRDDARIGCILMVEGADPIVTPDQLDLWYEQGVRMISLVHTGHNNYAVGNGSHAGGPLTDAGRHMLRRMQQLGVILDVSHLCDESFRDALDHFDGTIVATHSNCRHFVSGNRHLTDEQIRQLAGRGGVIGMVAFNSFLDQRWEMKHADQPPVSLTRMVDHIDHICQLTGDARHVGIGSDLDGGFGVQDTPAEIDTIADLQKLSGLLADRGYTGDDVIAILHGNWIRVYHTAMRNEGA